MARSVLSLLEKRFGTVTKDVRAGVIELSFPLLNELIVSTLDFESLDDLRSWLQAHSNGDTSSSA